ncbi:MAG: HNH endonuclease signature motif containing protein [Planctomycetaceae bacterium]
MAIPDDVRLQVRTEAADRCGYCLSPQELVLGTLEIEHLIPTSRGGTDAKENLWLACRMCNNFKSDQTETVDPATGESVQIFDPRRQIWSDHFTWTSDGTLILGKTRVGRGTVVALRLNNLIAVTVRRHWVAAGWHPPRTEP